jgi:hypothetical protein
VNAICSCWILKYYIQQINITQKANGLELTTRHFSATCSPHVHYWLHYLLATGGNLPFHSVGDESLYFVQAHAKVIQRDEWVDLWRYLDILTQLNSCKIVILNLVYLSVDKYRVWQLDINGPMLQIGNEICHILSKNKKTLWPSLFTIRREARGSSTRFVPVSNGCITFGTLVTTYNGNLSFDRSHSVLL